MTASSARKRAMRAAHARHAFHCTCGKVVRGNGARAAHAAMHARRGDGHRYSVDARELAETVDRINATLKEWNR